MVKAKTSSAAAGDGAPKEMLTTSLRKSLTKQVNNFVDQAMFSFQLFNTELLVKAIKVFRSFEATLFENIKLRQFMAN